MKLDFKQIVFTALVLLAIHVKGQKSITIAIDPLTTVMLNGFEVEAGFNFNKNRIAVFYLNGDLTPWYGDLESYKSTSHSTIDISFSRFLNEEQKGFSYGLSYAYFTEFKVENEAGETIDQNPSRVSVKLAYSWFPWEDKGFYVEPIMSFGLLTGGRDLKFQSGEKFVDSRFIGNGPILNIGYKFDF